MNVVVDLNCDEISPLAVGSSDENIFTWSTGKQRGSKWKEITHSELIFTVFYGRKGSAACPHLHDVATSSTSGPRRQWSFDGSILIESDRHTHRSIALEMLFQLSFECESNRAGVWPQIAENCRW